MYENDGWIGGGNDDALFVVLLFFFYIVSSEYPKSVSCVDCVDDFS